MSEAFVVLEVIDDVAQSDVLHLPARQRRLVSGRGHTDQTFEDRIEHGFPPSSWPAACGAFDRGLIYVQGGPLTGRPVCPACTAAVAPPPTRMKLRKAQREVLALLESGQKRVKEIAAARGTSEQAASQTLGTLVDRGFAVIVKRGVYALAGVAVSEREPEAPVAPLAEESGGAAPVATVATAGWPVEPSSRSETVDSRERLVRALIERERRFLDELERTLLADLLDEAA